MSESLNNPSSTSKALSHIAYHVRDRKDGDAYWTRIGSAWQYADRKGFNIISQSLRWRLKITAGENCRAEEEEGHRGSRWTGEPFL